MTVVLALDQSMSRSGWAVLVDGRVHNSGWFGARGGPIDCDPFRWHVLQLILDYNPDILAWEKPGTFRSMRANVAGARLDQMLKDLAHERGLKAMSASVKTWRAKVLGKGAGNLPSDEAKARALYYCRMFGMRVDDHNQAEAICIGVWATSVADQEALD